MNADHAPPTGVPGYQLARWIGAGGAASVYAATRSSSGERVAIKVFHPADERALARLEELLRANALLAHPDILRIEEIGRTVDGRLFTATPLLLGFERVRRELGSSPLRIAALLRAVLDGLGHAHRHGVVHGGIKPANLLFDAQRRAQLADFGIAGWEAECGLMHPDAAAWLSPEQARGEAPDRRSDVYGVGVLAFALLTGTLPFGEPAAPMPSGDPDATIRVPRLPPRAGAWQPWIDRALATAPEQRFPDADAMAAALGGIDGYGGHRATVSAPRPLRGSRGTVVGVIVAVAIVALGAWAVWPPRRSTFVGAPLAPAAAPANAPAATPAAPPSILPASASSVSPLVERVQGLIASANDLRAHGHLFSPSIRNAASQYLAALALDPGNRDAITGIDATLATARDRLDAAWRGDRIDDALAILTPGDALAKHAGKRARRAWRSRRDDLAKQVGDAVVAAAHAHDPARIAALQPLAEALPATYPAGLDFAEAERLATTPVAGEHMRDRGGPLLVYVPASGKVTAFAIAQVEVTRADYARFVRATHRPAARCLEAHNPFSWLGHRTWEAPGFAQDGNDPVVCVSWNDAVAYVAWLSKTTGETYRLPDSSEWLRAAQGMPRGDNACQLGNVDDISRKAAFDNDRWSCDDGGAQTAAVGHYAASGVGAYDMYGNVSEWLAGGTSGSRPFRGLSWRDGSHETALSAHGTADSDVGYTSVGFRVMRVVDAAHIPPRVASGQ